MNRRAQGLSVNMIILIVLGLIVLVIAILMFTKTSKDSGDYTSNCAKLGGMCAKSTKVVSTDTETACDATGNYFGTCPDQAGTKYVCCAKAEKPATTTPTG